jgi:hypothetical protein
MVDFKEELGQRKQQFLPHIGRFPKAQMGSRNYRKTAIALV